MNLIPYVEINGTRTISDKKLGEFFSSLDEETVKTVFYGGAVRSEECFVSMMKRPINCPVFVDDDGIKGVAWLNNIANTHACGHFCFPHGYRGQHAFNAAQKIIKYWFDFTKDGKPLFETIIGMVPEFNQRAVRFVQKLGFNLVGKLPKLERVASGETVDVYILYIERDGHG